jgi:hypothetical protein
MQLARRTLLVNAAAAALLAAMGALMFASAWDDTITFDEEPHIAAGFSYLRRADYRFNPEHPPLMKDLAALPLLFLNLNEPWDDPSWTAGEAWDFGAKLLYGSGNDPDSITRVARAPMILFAVALGWFLFWWTRREFGNGTALLGLFFYTFSPTFLAHGRYVTTDVGAAAGFFVSTAAFLSFLRNPSTMATVLAGASLGLALLAKFSTILLVPILLMLALSWALLQPDNKTNSRRWLRWVRRRAGFVMVVRWPASSKVLAQAAAVILIGFLAVYVVYLHHTWNYPADRQRADVERILVGRGVGHTPKDVTIWAADTTPFRPWGQYWAGLFQTVQRASNQQNRYFLGEIHTTGLPLYFPFVYLVKEPLALHILTLIAMVAVLGSRWQPRRWRDRISNGFTSYAFLLVIFVYWIASIAAGINIGVRHILPTFPFIFVLVAHATVAMVRRLRDRRTQVPILGWLPLVTLALLLGWHAISVVRVHPSYLAYFNELAGGPENGWHYVVDSNIDWGQDLKRLALFAEGKDIAELHLDYFGTAQPAYYLRERYRRFSSCDGPQKGWVAVSVMHYQHSRERPECDYRRWLLSDDLAAKIGYSIFVFHAE